VSARLATINELLQQFHGSMFITNNDFASAFLQIPWEKWNDKIYCFPPRRKNIPIYLHTVRFP